MDHSKNVQDSGFEDLFTSWRRHFGSVEDPRIDRTKQHMLEDILLLTLAAVLAGAEGWTDIERFGNAREAWLRQFLALPKGIPSHDTFGRVFAALDPEQFETAFVSWTQSLTRNLNGLVAVDGKTVRGSRDTASGKRPVHLVSAWSEANRLVLGQVRCEDHSNEITAIPRLLDGLDLSGCIVSIDAMGCQREIAQRIVDSEADYILALKGNQSTLHDDVRLWFEDAVKRDFRQVSHDYAEATTKGHGRIEVRRCWTLTDLAWLRQRNAWPKLRSIIVVESERRFAGEVAKERRYYMTSLEAGAAELGGFVRSHWGIENRMHWVLDVAFREDLHRGRSGHSAQNLALVRRIALNLLRRDTSRKVGIKTKRLEAAWNPEYLLQLLASF